MSKILYISDLDGTLLNSEKTVSDFTADVVNGLIEKGLIFSYATARSNVTANIVANKIDTRVPVILQNGTFIFDNQKSEILYSNCFKAEDADEIIAEILAIDVNPLVFSIIDGRQKYSYLADKISNEIAEFLEDHKGDVRENPVDDVNDLYAGIPFYFTCIEKSERLAPLYERFKDRFSCVYGKDIYSGHYWLEIMPPNTNKANAILKLKEMLGCDKIISFGDGINDIEMFKISDECYAPENADEALKPFATAIIDSNNADGVANWLLKNGK